MIKTLEINNEYIDSQWRTEDSRNEIKKRLSIIVEEFNIPVYIFGVEHFINCCKGYENEKLEFPVEYGYGLTFDSLNKYLSNKYGENNRNEYLVCAYTLFMDYEKIYKCGNYINLSGENTENDHYDCTDFDKSKADIKDTFIGFDVFLLKTH